MSKSQTESSGCFQRENLQVFPLKERKSLSSLENILITPGTPPPAIDQVLQKQIDDCVLSIKKAREKEKSVMLVYGAHLLRNGTAHLLEQLMKAGWITHVATNGAGSIHDWEYAFLGRSLEKVEENVRQGSFGAWDETGKHILLALALGATQGHGYGQSMGRYIIENGGVFPSLQSLEKDILSDLANPLSEAKLALLKLVESLQIPAGPLVVEHPNPHGSILAQAYRHQIPATIHPGIGYDIIVNHPAFRGDIIGRAATMDFDLFSQSVTGLDDGVLLSVGSAIMGPQVFEKSLEQCP